MLIHPREPSRLSLLVHAILFGVALCFDTSTIVCAQNPSSTNSDVWVGWLDTKSQNLRLILEINSNQQGKPSGTITSPDQSDVPIAITNASIDSQKQLSFQVTPNASSNTSYTFLGKLDQDSLVGQIQQAGTSLPITFVKTKILPPEDKDLLGANSAWIGSLEVGTRKVPLRFRIYDRPPYASPTAPRILMDSLAENANGFPTSIALADNGQFEFSIPAIPGNAKYIASLSQDQTKLTGKFQQGFLPLELVMQRTGTLASNDPANDPMVKYLANLGNQSKKSPDKSPDKPTAVAEVKQPNANSPVVMDKIPDASRVLLPSGIEEEEFVVDRFDSRKPLLNDLGKRADNKFELAGTITYPKGFDPKALYPAVVLITGSGPQDRDETIGKHKPFKQIAAYLASQGMVVLRFDDRGVGRSSGDFSEATSKDFADDALAVWQFARDIPGVDRSRTGLLGHSEGGIIGPMVAAWQREVAFLILIAPPVLPGTEILSSQIDKIAELEGVEPEDRAAARALQKELQQIALRFPNDDQAAVSEVRKAVVQRWDSLSKISESLAVNDQESKKKLVIDAITAQFRGLQSPWMRHFLAYDPSANWVLFDCPVLSVWAEKDTQVLYEPNLKKLQEIVAHNTNLKVDMLVMPGLNHLLQKANSGLPNEYDRIDQGIEPLALETFGNWLKQKEILP